MRDDFLKNDRTTRSGWWFLPMPLLHIFLILAFLLPFLLSPVGVFVVVLALFWILTWNRGGIWDDKDR